MVGGRALAAILLLGLLVPAPLAAAASPGPVASALVTFAGPLSPALVGAVEAQGVRVVETFPFVDAALVEGSEGAIDRVRGLPGVASVVPDEPLTLLLERERQATRADLPPTAPGAWGANVTVAFVDSGFDASHPGFDGRVRVSLRFDRGGPGPGGADADGHGTHVAGILAGSGAESRDARYRGYAPHAGIAALDISPSFTTSNAVRAFQWIHEHHGEHDIRVVSNSWGREREEARYDPNDPLVRASNALVAEGMVVVFSAGNRGEAGRSSLTVEAMNPNVVTVGAASVRGTIERYSSRGPALDEDGREVPWVKPDVVAPGTHVWSARTSARAAPDADGEDRYYVVMNGTSMAAPQVAGAAALLLSAEPSLSPGVVQALLQHTARDLGPAGPDPDAGYGMLDVSAALEALARTDARPSVVKVVRHEPFQAEGAASGAGEALVLHGRQPATGERVEVPLRLEDGTERVDLWFNWTGPGGFRVFLEGPKGQVGPFAQASPGVVPVRADVTPGAWRLVAEPSGPVTHADWTVEGALEIVETHYVEPRGAELPQGRPVWGEGGFYIPPQVWFDERTLVRSGLAFAGVCLVAGLTLWRSRKG